MGISRNRCVFLDRDGVINLKLPEGRYVTRWEEFEFLPGVAEGIRALNQASWLVMLATNQRAVAKRLLTESELRQIHRNMLEELGRDGATVDAIYFCPHDVEDDCQCRKPKPGMILQAGREHQINLSASWMIGDSVMDVEAGKAAGCRTIWLKSRVPYPTASSQPDFVAVSIARATARILEGDKPFRSGNWK